MRRLEFVRVNELKKQGRSNMSKTRLTHCGQVLQTKHSNRCYQQAATVAIQQNSPEFQKQASRSKVTVGCVAQ